MFSFRYHAISLVAVLVALAVGVLLGVAIGDAGLVSSAEQNLRADVREELGKAEDRAAGLETKLAGQRRSARAYEDASYPLLSVGGWKACASVWCSWAHRRATSATRSRTRSNPQARD